MKLDALVAPLPFVELDESRAIRRRGHEERVVAELIRLGRSDDHPIGLIVIGARVESPLPEG